MMGPPVIANDKLLHFLAGGMIAGIAAPLALVFGINPAFACLGASAASGAAKEAYDATGRGQVEFADFAWTVMGGAIPAAIWLMT